MTSKQIESMAVNAATPDEPKAYQIAKYCESLTQEETQYFLTIFNLIRAMRSGAIEKDDCTRIKELSKGKMQRFQNWQENVRKFYTSQIKNVENQRIMRNELVEKLKSGDASGTLETALKLIDALTGENIYLKMSHVLRSGIYDEEFDRIVSESAQGLLHQQEIKDEIGTIVNLLNEM